MAKIKLKAGQIVALVIMAIIVAALIAGDAIAYSYAPIITTFFGSGEQLGGDAAAIEEAAKSGDELVRKLVTRHTHIFGEDRADDEAQALERWEAAKAKEKHAETLESKLARIPDTFPALLKLQKTLKKLVEAGLVNDAEERSARDLLICACGALKSGADIEPDLIREVNALAAAFTSGKITKVSELK